VSENKKIKSLYFIGVGFTLNPYKTDSLDFYSFLSLSFNFKEVKFISVGIFNKECLTFISITAVSKV